jgi:N6-L-threonylcarbamoyladenine synthase
LRERLVTEADSLGLRLLVPLPRYCTDNAAMVASAGRHRFLLGIRAGPELNAIPTWPLEKLQREND